MIFKLPTWSLRRARGVSCRLAPGHHVDQAGPVRPEAGAGERLQGGAEPGAHRGPPEGQQKHPRGTGAARGKGRDSVTA